MDRPHLLIPLGSALVYTVAATLCQRASRTGGLGPWRIAFVANVVMGVLYLPLLFWADAEVGGSLWQPLLAASCFMVGQIFTFLALELGDVSIVTPVLGSKVLVVALQSGPLLGQPLPPVWWVAAALTVLGLVVLGRAGGPGREATAPAAPGAPPVTDAHYAAPRPAPHLPRLVANPSSGRRTASALPAIVAAAISAAAFATSDVLVQRYAPGRGLPRFIVETFVVVAISSVVFLPFFRGKLFPPATPRGTWPALAGGSVLLAVQALGMGVTLGRFGDAAAVNIVYSTRGLWSVFLAWVLGRWAVRGGRSSSRERLPPRVLTLRLIGAGLIAAAVGLALG